MLRERPSRAEKLAGLVCQARRIIQIAPQPETYILRVLTALSDDDMSHLGQWNLNGPVVDAILDRLSTDLQMDRRTLRQALGDCLRLDVWGQTEERLPSSRLAYFMSGMPDAEIEKRLPRQPHKTYWFLLHTGINYWCPQHTDYGLLDIDDDHWSAICTGYLFVQGRAFLSKLDVLEASITERWERWEKLWEWF